MEKCKVVDKDGKGLIKAHKGECATSKHSCAGHNGPGDPESWILVPKGECKNINAGEFSGVDDNIKEKTTAEITQKGMPYLHCGLFEKKNKKKYEVKMQ